MRDVEIDSLVLHLRSVTPERAEALAGRVGERLQARFSETERFDQTRSIMPHVQLEISTSVNEETIADQIVSNILRRLL